MSFCFLFPLAIFPSIETQRFSESFALVIRVRRPHFVKLPRDFISYGGRFKMLDLAGEKGTYESFAGETRAGSHRESLGIADAISYLFQLRDDSASGSGAALRRTFLDSRDSLGLQLADMLATIMRRALNDHLKYVGWKDFGRLVAGRSHETSNFLQLGSPVGTPEALEGHAEKVGLALRARAKPMMLR